MEPERPDDAARGGLSPADVDDAYRGFLFADLRGYTSFVERHGDAAAADLLDAYRALVRDVVASFDGAEIRTEGDSFYVVFRSARRAVACGLAIVAAAEQFRATQPDRPIRVGIGINAGESVQRREGFVGTAVNLAARVCAQANAGEVLVTSTVRDAAGSGAGLRFHARGSRRLKGIARPVALFAVELDTASAHRPLSNSLAAVPWLRVGVVAIAAVLTIAVAAVSGWPGSPPPAGSDLSAAAVPASPGSPTAGVSPTGDPGAFPNAMEAELLSRLNESIAPHCERADDGDRPVLRLDPDEARFIGVPARLPINVEAGLACEIPSLEAPDMVHFWTARYTYYHQATQLPGALIVIRAGATIPRGSCSSEGAAYDRWELGDLGGWLMCREEYGDAVIEWSYDGTAIYGIAVRRDGDRAALLRWWTEEARLLRP
jgi:class 3 adenylate cyclase